jgi:hypothetical protein
MKKLSTFCLLISLAACEPASNSNTQSPAHKNEIQTVYTCSMHPEVKMSKPGLCPKCGMDLIKKQN